MIDNSIVDIEPIQIRSGIRNQSRSRPKRAELKDIAGSDTLVLATAIAEAFMNGMEMKERRRIRRRLLLIACGLAFLTGMTRMAIFLIHN